MANVNCTSFIEAYKAAYPEKSKAVLFRSAQDLWNDVKKDNNNLLVTFKILKKEPMF